MNWGNKMWIYELFFKNIVKKVLVMGVGWESIIFVNMWWWYILEIKLDWKVCNEIEVIIGNLCNNGKYFVSMIRF